MPTKAEMEQTLGEIETLVDEALDPEITREEVVAKVKQISDLVSEDDDEGDDDEEGDAEEDE